MSDELWAEVPSAPGYEVSTLGRVRSWTKCGGSGGPSRRSAPRPISPVLDTKGYPNFSARIDGRTVRMRVHRCVLEAFVGPCPDGMIDGCHNNGIRSDNRLSNLRWDTRAGNAADRARHGTMRFGENHPASRLTAEQVREIRERRERGEQMQSIAEAFGIVQGTVSKIVNGKRWARCA